MTGADIMGALLRESSSITALVRAAGIKAGRLADNEALPVMLVRSISVVDRQTLAREDMVRSTERVSVTLRTANYRDLTLLLRRVRSAGNNVVIAEMGEARNISILTAGTGPDLNGPGNSFERNQDFSVTYDAPA